MHVVATAGHVDHGKSTLVRALTGMEPDRWAEERRRGMTIDLGYAWTTLESGAVLAVVDVPGHQRFVGNMLAGLGPAPAVLFVVAADEGWCRQSAEHLAAADALGLRSGLLAVTRADLADAGPATEQALAHLRRSSLGQVEAVVVSGATGAGLPQLRKALDRLVTGMAEPDRQAPVRLWVDRVFTVRGSGTVATGTLTAGSLRSGDELSLNGRAVRVKGLQSLGVDRQEVTAVARVAVNLRGVERHRVARGDVLLTVDAWRSGACVDVQLTADPRTLPEELVLHVGTAAVAARLRPLDDRAARLTLHRALPLRAGDRALLRNPGAQAIAAGVLVLDADPPALRRRGAATAWAQTLRNGVPDLAAQVHRRGCVRRAELAVLGIPVDDVPTVRVVGDWLVDAGRWASWSQALVAAVDAHAVAAPLEAGLPADTARRELGLPDQQLLAALAGEAGLAATAGRLHRRDARLDLGAAEPAVALLEKRLAQQAFAAPEARELLDLGLTSRELAAAVRAGRLLRLRDDVVLLPDGPARAMRVLAALPQPFTVSSARQALGTTRRVAMPLLEHLDSRGWTRRIDAALREVRRGG